MHGIILYELQEHAVGVMGRARWNALLARKGLSGRTFTPVDAAPDSVVADIVGELSAELGLPPEDILEGFGRYLAKDLLEVYRPFVDASWTLADLLEHVEAVIHKAVRVSDPTTTPPVLTTSRPGIDAVVIRYASPRRLCALARGLINGLAVIYREAAHVDETRCMHRGDAECVFDITIRPAADDDAASA